MKTGFVRRHWRRHARQVQPELIENQTLVSDCSGASRGEAALSPQWRSFAASALRFSALIIWKHFIAVPIASASPAPAPPPAPAPAPACRCPLSSVFDPRGRARPSATCLGAAPRPYPRSRARYYSTPFPYRPVAVSLSLSLSLGEHFGRKLKLVGRGRVCQPPLQFALIAVLLVQSEESPSLAPPRLASHHFLCSGEECSPRACIRCS
ncbi:hypothetical protein Mp_8g16220 [Marchantia polymorpha subsp. ruderalis]|uniref:Uncharacterized protein n=1 Tax=Marchantia polymorpha TaxID=3197 RepID=A0A2R6W4Q0_MARPO|nr:hypothetical protein MARPO_0154s0042 [Marchantia polymorpha]BBN20073.1 hypothetical protein Mp_8g16220 [Marchantia polymorpha subsp. ruderalis]PTQ28819.1 hypothetical protein MARPO_0154s0042 [Marchantia polymorpha]PTQ28820.1 hypothetical protein MARPO_0154s0042 [Marchantia polymorpha]BBN20074.1 hypothetical protein Mp_8g16220 [Marchantia polymorpha subsp. ruderalis]|eukprot:PTQ28818.1 hypothetical protein MARPO_0154s0042 [Marchantia polymorpha]